MTANQAAHQLYRLHICQVSNARLLRFLTANENTHYARLFLTEKCPFAFIITDPLTVNIPSYFKH